tara:strand:- start:189 stop:812 length:624 start_codon:yes stop_codon:yes gene_type:complete
MARKPWSKEAKKAQSKRIKKMWADKKKSKIKEASATLKPVKEAYIMPPPVVVEENVEERDLNTVSATWVDYHLEECLKECKTKDEMTKYLKDMMETVDRIKSEDRREAHRRHEETAIHDNVTDAEILIIGDGYNINGIQEPQRIMGSIPFWVPYDVSMMDHLPEDQKALEWFVNVMSSARQVASTNYDWPDQNISVQVRFTFTHVNG